MNKMGLFQIQYEDETQFKGYLFQQDWGKIPDHKRIKEIIFSVGNKTVKMESFQEYNLTFETHVMIGKAGRIVNVTLVGRGDSHSILHIFDCVNGKILRKEVDKYKEYQWVSSTWKEGIQNGVPKDYHG
jgi:hypothetical protein